MNITFDDAHRLLAKLNDEPAYVFGSSSGAVIALDLCIRYPQQVKVFIPHEPILLQLLLGDEQVQARQFLKDLEKNGLHFTVANIYQFDQLTAEQKERITQNRKYFIMNEVPGIRKHTFDIDLLKSVLKSSPMQILPSGGSASQMDFPFRCAVALAEQLETTFIEFPGNHTSYNSSLHRKFAEKLHVILES